MNPSSIIFRGKHVGNVDYVIPPSEGWQLIESDAPAPDWIVRTSTVGPVLLSGTYEECLSEARRITNLETPNQPLLCRLKLRPPVFGWRVDSDGEDCPTMSVNQAFARARKFVEKLDGLSDGMDVVPERVRRIL